MPKNECANCRKDAAPDEKMYHLSGDLYLCYKCAPASAKAKLRPAKVRRCAQCGATGDIGWSRLSKTRWLCEDCSPDGGIRRYADKARAVLRDDGMVDESGAPTMLAHEVSKDPKKRAIYQLKAAAKIAALDGVRCAADLRGHAEAPTPPPASPADRQETPSCTRFPVQAPDGTPMRPEPVELGVSDSGDALQSDSDQGASSE